MIVNIFNIFNMNSPQILSQNKFWVEEECFALSNTIFSEYCPKHTKALVVPLSRMSSSFLWPLIISRDAYLRHAFCVMPFRVMLFCVMPICGMPFRVMPFRVMSFRVMPFRVMPFCVMPFHVTLFRVMPFRVMLFYAFYNSVCLSAFWLAVWYLKRVFALQLRFDAFQIWNKESACYYSALDWCIPDLKHRIGLLLFSFGLMHEQFG